MKEKNKIQENKPAKKNIFRKCSGCGEIKDRKDLVKITRFHKTGEIIINPDPKHFGRSAYLCYNKECLKNAIKKKRLHKILKKELSPQIISELERIIN